eukprot:scaffold43469_cov34-Tisochrysis_lutea.AAC.4
MHPSGQGLLSRGTLRVPQILTKSLVPGPPGLAELHFGFCLDAPRRPPPPCRGESRPIATRNVVTSAGTSCSTCELLEPPSPQLERDSFRRHEAEWFATFLRKHGSSLRGSTESGAAADFLARLMEQPLLVGTSLGGNPRFTDPLALAERLLELRVRRRRPERSGRTRRRCACTECLRGVGSAAMHAAPMSGFTGSLIVR